MKKHESQLLENFPKKIGNMKAQTLFFFVRIVCLINYVLSSLPLFHLSFFKIPQMLVRKIESIQKKFFLKA